MTTVAPPTIKMSDSSSLERIAYDSVKTIPTKEPNDQHRLGYHVWRYLKEKEGSLSDVVKLSGARILISEKEALDIIESELKKYSAE